MRDVSQALRKTQEAFGQIFRCAALAHGEHGQRVSETCGQARTKTRAVIEDAVVKSMVAQTKLPMNAGGDV